MKNNQFVIVVALIVALGGFLMGFDASVISGVNKFIEAEFGLSKLELGWAVSSLTLSATLAMMVAGPLSDRLGRKGTVGLNHFFELLIILDGSGPLFLCDFQFTDQCGA